MLRRKTRVVAVGSVKLGGDSPIVVQSMTNTDTRDVEQTLAQIDRLAGLGCELVRLAVPDRASAHALAKIKTRSPLPLIADIHFDYNLALAALAAGADKVRINPGTMNAKALNAVAAAAIDRKVPLRIGVNSGSLHRKYTQLPAVQALVNSAGLYCQQLEELGLRDIVVSLKSSSVAETFSANLEFAAKSDYPLHLGVTEAGTIKASTIKSSIGIGALLLQGIGDTLRVSVTGPPESEIPVALGILRALGLKPGVDIISCPTCARSGYDVAQAAAAVEAFLSGVVQPLKIAVMGCAVNGPGEAKQADYGIAFGPAEGVLFAEGRVLATLPNQQLIPALIELISSAPGPKI